MNNQIYKIVTKYELNNNTFFFYTFQNFRITTFAFQINFPSILHYYCINSAYQIIWLAQLIYSVEPIRNCSQYIIVYGFAIFCSAFFSILFLSRKQNEKISRKQFIAIFEKQIMTSIHELINLSALCMIYSRIFHRKSIFSQQNFRF